MRVQQVAVLPERIVFQHWVDQAPLLDRQVLQEPLVAPQHAAGQPVGIAGVQLCGAAVRLDLEAEAIAVIVDRDTFQSNCCGNSDGYPIIWTITCRIDTHTWD